MNKKDMNEKDMNEKNMNEKDMNGKDMNGKNMNEKNMNEKDMNEKNMNEKNMNGKKLLSSQSKKIRTPSNEALINAEFRLLLAKVKEKENQAKILEYKVLQLESQFFHLEDIKQLVKKITDTFQSYLHLSEEFSQSVEKLTSEEHDPYKSQLKVVRFIGHLVKRIEDVGKISLEKFLEKDIDAKKIKK